MDRLSFIEVAVSPQQELQKLDHLLVLKGGTQDAMITTMLLLILHGVEDF